MEVNNKNETFKQIPELMVFLSFKCDTNKYIPNGQSNWLVVIVIRV